MHNANIDNLYRQQEISEDLSPSNQSIERAKELESTILSNQDERIPLPLQRECEPPKPFPFDALGNILGPAAQQIHNIIQAPDSICGNSVLAAAALAIQAHANLEIDGRSMPLSLFFLSVAESGDRKSAADNIALSPIHSYQKMLFDIYKIDLQKFQNDYDLWHKKRQALLSKMDDSCIEEKLRAIGEEPIPPLKPIMIMEEPTYEGLVKLFELGQPSLGLFSDEGRMFGGIGMDKNNLLKTACGLSSLWDGKPISRVRSSDETAILYGRRFSSHLMIQEIVLENILRNPILNSQGLLARCLIVFPTSMVGKRKYQETNPFEDEAIKKYHQRLSEILDHPFPLENSKNKNILKPKTLKLSAEAKNKWILSHDELEQLLASNASYFSVRRTGNKLAEQALRTAGCIALFNNLEAIHISSEDIERGIILAKFYLDEALRIFYSTMTDPNLILAQQVLDWMKRQVKEKNIHLFPLHFFYQKGHTSLRTAKKARQIMKTLQEHDTVIFLPGHKVDGIMRKEVWALNDKLLETSDC